MRDKVSWNIHLEHSPVVKILAIRQRDDKGIGRGLDPNFWARSVPLLDMEGVQSGGPPAAEKDTSAEEDRDSKAILPGELRGRFSLIGLVGSDPPVSLTAGLAGGSEGASLRVDNGHVMLMDAVV
jgi:hypothetical protein